MLEESINEYNDIYTLMNDKGVRLFVERNRAVDSIDNVKNLINSIANHPKEFDAEFEEIENSRKKFKDTCEFADKELKAARQVAGGMGAGMAAGASVAFMAPTAAMWIATTFGTASTGAAISTLSGAAATNAALAWLGGGALAAGPAALFNVYFNASFLNCLLALLVLFAAFSSFKPPRHNTSKQSRWLSPRGLFVIGMVTGTMAGITGAGGPLLAIAWMVPCGMPPLAAIGLTMPYSLATALTATFSNWLNANVDGPMLLKAGSLELAGFICGVLAVSHMPVLWIRRLMAVTCAVLGLFLLVRSLFLPV